VEDNIQKIQELYIEEGNKGEKGVIEDKEVILVRGIYDNIIFIKYKFYNG